MRSRRVKLKFLCLLFLSLVMLNGCSEDSSPVISQSPSPAALTLSSPTRIAVAPSGQLVVSDYAAGNVLFFDSDTLQAVSKIRVSGKLTAVGATEDKVLIGFETSGAIGVYSYAGDFLYALGAGIREFGRPSDLVVDPTGALVYVADSGAKNVKIYNLLDGSYVDTWGQGQMYFPTGIAFDHSDNTLLIADFGAVKTGGGSMSFEPESYSAGIWRFDLNGNYVETITGAFSRPQGVAVNSSGEIFIVDSLLGEVLTLKETIVSAGYEIIDRYGAELPLELPLDVVLAEQDNKLFVTNNLAAQVVAIDVGGN